MNPAENAKKPWLFRIYEWPLSYFVGLLIGSGVAVGFAAWDSSLRVYLEPTGILLFLSGWAIIIGSGFGNGMDKFIDLPQPTRFQKWILRSSIAIGIALNAIAWTFFTTPTETWGEQGVAVKASPDRT